MDGERQGLVPDLLENIKIHRALATDLLVCIKVHQLLATDLSVCTETPSPALPDPRCPPSAATAPDSSLTFCSGHVVNVRAAFGASYFWPENIIADWLLAFCSAAV